MDFSTLFRQWVAQGTPKGPAQHPPGEASTLQSADKDKLVRRIVTQTIGRVGAELDAALSSELRGLPGKKATERKRQFAKLFFLQLDSQQQDAISELAQAYRTNTMTRSAAQYLDLPPEDFPDSVPEVERAPNPPRKVPPQSSATSTVHPWFELQKSQKSQVLKNCISQVVERCRTKLEAESFLDELSKRVLKVFGAKRSDRMGRDCSRCHTLLPKLQECRTSLTEKQPLEEALAATFKKRKRMVDAGFPIGAKAWKRAKLRTDKAETRGRPAKSKSAKLIQEVVEAITNNTQPSTKWLPKLEREARTLTASMHQIYWGSGLVGQIKKSLFYDMAAEHCPWAIVGTKETDVCDHCWLLKSKIQPGLTRMVGQARRALEQALPGYFRTLDLGQPAGIDVASEVYLQKFCDYIEEHSDKQRAARATVKGAARIDLHRLEAKVLSHFKWEREVYFAYLWHETCKDRQNASITSLQEHLPIGALLIWMDWKQNLSLPLAGTETGDMFYGTERHECSVHGIFLLQNVGGELRKTHLVQVSPIIEHSALASSQLLDRIKNHVPDWQKLTYIYVYSDCGPHYRCQEMLAYWIGEWFAKVRCNVQVNFFCEKHGKGTVDTLFSRVNSWISAYTKNKNARIESVEQLVKVLSDAAAEATRFARRGDKYLVDFWDTEKKPTQTWRLEVSEVSIMKTYCLEICPQRKDRLKPVLLDFVLSDQSNDRTNAKRCITQAQQVKIEAAPWRRGYFGSKRWDRAVPKKGDKDTIMARQAHHTARGLDTSSRFPQETSAEKYLRRHARRLIKSRERYKERLEAGSKEDSSSPSSSSSSSSESD